MLITGINVPEIIPSVHNFCSHSGSAFRLTLLDGIVLYWMESVFLESENYNIILVQMYKV